jgi:hypothetical protein
MNKGMQIARVPSAANTQYELLCKKMGHVIANIITDRALKVFSFRARLSENINLLF